MIVKIPGMNLKKRIAMQKLNPRGDRVVVKRIEAAGITPGGIHLPDNVDREQKIGEVLAVGPGKINDVGMLIKIDLKVGAKVVFGEWGANKIEIDDEEFLLVQDNDIHAVIEEVDDCTD